MRYWINTYHPLAATPDGPWSRHIPKLPPFADASCRREPDLEAQHPTITGLCRTRAVTTLHCGDIVAYFTVKRPYFGKEGHRRLTAVLRIVHDARSHVQAAKWYEERGLLLPRNVMVYGNPPLPIDATEGGYREGDRIVAPTSPADAPRVLAHWDALYEERRLAVGDVRICTPVLLDIWDGYIFNDEQVHRVFGDAGFPNTQWRPSGQSAETMVSILHAVGRSDLIEWIIPSTSDETPSGHE